MSWSPPRVEEIATSAEVGGYQDDLDRGEPRHDDDRARSPRVDGSAHQATRAERSSEAE